MFNSFTAAPVSGRPSPATGTLPFGIHPGLFAQYAAALQAQQVRQAAALSAPEPSRVVQPLQFINAAPAEAPATAENEVCAHFLCMSCCLCFCGHGFV